MRRSKMHLKVSDKDAPFYDVIDLDTGKRIPLVQEADDETGEYVVIATNANGKIKLDNDLCIIKVKKKGRIKLVKKEIKNE
jgi:hypothetical protein